jgi:hypothetical protein
MIIMNIMIIIIVIIIIIIIIIIKFLKVSNYKLLTKILYLELC